MSISLANSGICHRLLWTKGKSYALQKLGKSAAPLTICAKKLARHILQQFYHHDIKRCLIELDYIQSVSRHQLHTLENVVPLQSAMKDLKASRNSILETERSLRGCSHRSSKILKIMFANFLNFKVNDLRGLSATKKQKVFWRPNATSEVIRI